MARQSLSRAIRRHNAVIVFNEVFKTNEVVYKKGETNQRWYYACKNKLTDEQDKYLAMATRPLTEAFIDKQGSKRKAIYCY